MNSRRIGFMMVLAGASAAGWVAGCSDDDSSPTVQPDGGTPPIDIGFPDSGPPPDVGFRDTGPRPDAGHYCAMNDQVTVDGMAVPVDPATEVASLTVGSASLSCIDSELPNLGFAFGYCITQCLNFFGYTPTAEEVEGLEFAAFPLTNNDEPVDPSFDYQTYRDREPQSLLPIGFRTLPVESNECSSGWKVELGYSNLGPDTFESDLLYVIRVRSSSTAAAFATTYLYRQIRRNDQTNNSVACRTEEERIPDVKLTFPVIPATLIDEAVQAGGAAVPGSDDLFDGLGTGYAMVEVRDCSGGSGSLTTGATSGTLPAPVASFYPTEDLMLGTERQTSGSGLYFAVGFPGLTATSSGSTDVRVGVGVNRNPGTCTEEYGGITMPIFSDGVTFVRANRETVIHND